MLSQNPSPDDLLAAVARAVQDLIPIVEDGLLTNMPGTRAYKAAEDEFKATQEELSALLRSLSVDTVRKEKRPKGDAIVFGSRWRGGWAAAVASALDCLPKVAGHEITVARERPDSPWTLSGYLLPLCREFLDTDGVPTPEARAEKGKPGRKPTRQALARLANTLRKRENPMTWEDIAVEWTEKHEDDPVDWEKVRDAWRRHYGDKAKSQK